MNVLPSHAGFFSPIFFASFGAALAEVARHFFEARPAKPRCATLAEQPIQPCQ
jgi:hypothetical protein